MSNDKEKNIVWKVASSNSPSIAPNQMKKEEWTPQDWADNIRYFISTGFNQAIYSPALRNGEKNTPYDNINTGHVYQYVHSVSYLFGLQFGTEYEWAAKDSKNQPTKIPMWRGVDIRNIFGYFDGQCRAKFSGMPKLLQAQGITENIISKKRLKLDALKRMVEAQNFIEDQEAISGVKVDFEADGLDLRKKQNQDKYFRNFQDEMERAYRNIGKDFLIRNNFLQLFLKSSQYTFIGGRTQTKVYESKGRVYMRTIPPQNSIIDMTQDDDQHYKDNFGGSIEAFSIPQLTTMDDYTTDELELLESQAKNEPNIPIGGTGFMWYNYSNNVPKVWRAEVEWKSITYVNDEPVQCIRQGTLVGNILLKNCRIKPNSITNKLDKSQKELDYIAFSPFTFLNTNMGVIMLIHKLLDLKSALMTKWVEMFSRAKGKVPFLDSSKFPSFMKTPDVLAEIEQQGFLVGNRAESEGEAEGTNRMMENLDFTIDPNVNTIMTSMEYLDAQIGQILNMPRYAIQGTGDYQSKDQVQNNVQSSDIGTSWLYGGLQTHFLRIIDRATEKYILVSSKEDKEYFALQIGDNATDLLSMKEIQELLLDGFRPYLAMNNELTEQMKATLGQMAVQNAAINPNANIEFITIAQAETIDDVRVYFEEERHRREEAEAAKMEADRAAAERNASINANAMTENTKVQADASLQKTEMDNETKLLETVLKNKEQPSK